MPILSPSYSRDLYDLLDHQKHDDQVDQVVMLLIFKAIECRKGLLDHTQRNDQVTSPACLGGVTEMTLSHIQAKTYAIELGGFQGDSRIDKRVFEEKFRKLQRPSLGNTAAGVRWRDS